MAFLSDLAVVAAIVVIVVVDVDVVVVVAFICQVNVYSADIW